MFKIERRIRVPAKAVRYPFKSMKVGDSFLLNGVPRNTVAAAAVGYASRRKAPRPKFTLRKTPDGVRCWRIK